MPLRRKEISANEKDFLKRVLGRDDLGFDFIKSILKDLKKAQARIITLHYGLINQRKYSFEEIASLLGISLNRVMKIESKALDQIRGSIFLKAKQ